ncbi:MAG: NTP transferase domain-containing protein [Candidatus Eisenbacteria bacterium]|uniref:NTP transferase domain-containing protein n=1 Tax=Eiseniibacteriota bacterium TaxID=2212470 RepID=A0A956ND56_UNCEI|nr:NTP transferase domain-containing protein [Candidatus Eisenbacteria bacterium]MCB9465010.1 NTP transferase domain-containing protein [Candidatus Eisenbacteria bacterium]
MSPAALDRSRDVQDLRRTLTLILAGGVGSRLNVLVQRRAKPAVPFGGIYRIIDFAISNAMNSGVETVGILTQYLPYSLTDHIGDGHSWGLVGRSREARILPPHQGTQGSDWYKGTADAVYRNLSYIERHAPDQVLVLSGDHVYAMDYRGMVAQHIEKQADVTIAVRSVPIEEASSFGTIFVDDSGRITGFEEKPQKPRSNLISMGIYVFDTRVLVDRLLEVVGEKKRTDFGHDIFPDMLTRGDHLSTYRYEGYWQDVGTIRAYFDSHMDLVASDPIDIRSWSVRTNLDEARIGDRPAAWIGPSGSVQSAIVARGCRIGGTVRNSILSPGVVVEEGATVENSILLADCRIAAGARLDHAILDKLVEIGPSAVVGGCGEDTVNERFPGHLDTGISLIGKGARIPGHCKIERNVVVFPESNLTELGVSHVESGDTVDRRKRTEI